MSDRVLRGRVSLPNYEKIFNIHGFYVQQLSTNDGERPYFVYESLPEYMGGQPSNRVLQYVNHERCDDFFDDWENMEAILMLDGPSKATVVIHTIAAQANDYHWRALFAVSQGVENEFLQTNSDEMCNLIKCKYPPYARENGGQRI